MGRMSSSKYIVVRLKGGLGNQMFQYATARALAVRNGMDLVLDTFTGFARDRVYRRSYSLGPFPVKYRKAGLMEEVPFWYERCLGRIFASTKKPLILKRPWGLFVEENKNRFLDEVHGMQCRDNIWMEGYWQSEEYFDDCREMIGRELMPPEPKNPNFIDMGKKMKNCNSVAVGVRLYEEETEAKRHTLVPFSFYMDAARKLVEHMDDPVFFVFCTKNAGLEEKITLPGETHYITHDNGYAGALESLWLICQGKHHIISNSSFYWWGAWLSELNNPGSEIIACDLFSNSDCIPSRWLSLKP